MMAGLGEDVAVIGADTMGNAASSAPNLQQRVARGRVGVGSGKGLFGWRAQEVKAEQVRYQRAPSRARAVQREE